MTLWPDIDQAFADVAKQVRRAVEEQTDSAPKANLLVPRAQTPLASQVIGAAPARLPRSSNLRLKKEFTEQDRDEFLRKRLRLHRAILRGSLQTVEERNPGVKGTFERIDSRRFSAVFYKHGKAVSECSIRLEGIGRRSDGIAFSYDASADQGSYNEMLHVETNAQALFFRALGMQMGGGAREAQLSPEGARRRHV